MRIDRSWSLFVVFGIIFALFTIQSRAKIINAPSCSVADIQTAVNTAVHGDIVAIPAGTCTWSNQLNVTVGVTLQGSGQGSTTIIDNVPKDGSDSSRLMKVVVNAPNNFRLTAMSIVGQAPDSNVFNQGHIMLSGTMKAFRIDHLTVTTPKTSFIRTGGAALGLIDHITFSGDKNLLTSLPADWGGSAFGDGSWAAPIKWGSDEAIYVEDCTLTSPATVIVTNFFDGLAGSRVVIRHNQFVGGNVTSHGADSGQRFRGSRQMEVYNNTFTFPQSMPVDFVVWIRGGTGVVFNNAVTAPGGLNTLVKTENCRDPGAGCGSNSSSSFPPWGACDGTSTFDQNAPGQTGYRCVDQPGSGTSNHLNGLAAPPAEWVGNVSDPIYEWNNSISVTPVFGKVGGTVHVQANRDYFVDTPRPGYTPFVYPHPLSSGAASPPASPTNLRVISSN